MGTRIEKECEITEHATPSSRHRLTRTLKAFAIAAAIAVIGLSADPLLAAQIKSAPPQGAVGSTQGPRGSARRLPPPRPAQFSPGIVLFGFRPGIALPERLAVERAVGGYSARSLAPRVNMLGHDHAYPRQRPVPLKLRVGRANVLAVAARLRGNPAVAYAEPDYLMHASAVPDDQFFSKQWADDNTGQEIPTINVHEPEEEQGTSTGAPGDDDGALRAWEAGNTGSSTIVIGETDTGVDYEHPDLKENIWSNERGVLGCPVGTHGFNVSEGEECNPMDNDNVYGGHGTHVAGIMGAVGDNGKGVAGMNWHTTILPVKWLDSNAFGSTSQLIAALELLVAAKAAGVDVRVVNDSATFGGTARSTALQNELEVLGEHGILFVTAAGNAGEDNDTVSRYPCDYSLANEICVTATNNRDELAEWADYGAKTVDLAAPGVSIYSTLRGAGNEERYGFLSGGSMASPQVAGAAALILSAEPRLSTEQVKERILKNVDPVPALKGLVRTGGRLDVCKALPGCAASETASTTSLSFSTTSPVSGQPVTLSATISPAAPTPEGSVEFKNGPSAISGCQSRPIEKQGASFIATCQTGFNAQASPEHLSASFSSTNVDLQGSESPTETLTVAKASTSSALSVSNATPAVGETVTYSVAVAPLSPGAGQPTGSVSFKDKGVTIGHCKAQPLTRETSSSIATCRLSYPAVGSHQISARYVGDEDFSGSTSSTESVTVSVRSETVLGLSTEDPVTNQPVTITATVGAGNGAVAGTVSFDNQGFAIPGCESQPIRKPGASFIATCNTAFSASRSPGSATAIFTPTPGTGILASESPAKELTVAKAPTSTGLATSTTDSSVGEGVTYTAAVTSDMPGAIEPTGVVRFGDNGATIGICEAEMLIPTLPFLSATCTMIYPVTGTHDVMAAYMGDSNFSGSASTAQTVTVVTPAAGLSGRESLTGTGSTTGGGSTTTTQATETHTRTTPSARATLASTRPPASLKVDRHGVVTIRLACTGGGACAGKLTLTISQRVRRGKRMVIRSKVIAQGVFSIAPWATATVRLKLTSAGRTLFGIAHGHLSAAVRILDSAANAAETWTERVDLVPSTPVKATGTDHQCLSAARAARCPHIP